jgi:hypothetical protein
MTAQGSHPMCEPCHHSLQQSELPRELILAPQHPAASGLASNADWLSCRACLASSLMKLTGVIVLC